MYILNKHFIANKAQPLKEKTSFNGLLYSENGFNGDTFFFRDAEELEFINDYAKKHFPEGTPIYDYGCSVGEEAYSLAMIMTEGGSPDKKYKISCFDLNPKIIEIAKKGKHKVFNLFFKRDGFLVDEVGCSEKQKKYLNLFKKYFLEIQPNDELKTILDQRHQEMKALLGNLYKEKYFKVSENLSELVDFEIGNINNIENTAKNRNNKPGIVIFKNAWYHLTGNNLDFRDDWINTLSSSIAKTIKQINNVLPVNGILTVGNLAKDHFFIEPRDIECSFYVPCLLRVIKPSPFHELLKENGFKPIFNSELRGNYTIKKINGEYVPFETEIKVNTVPSVWQKIK